MKIHIIDRKQTIMKYLMEYPEIFTELEKSQIINYNQRFSKYTFVPDTVREIYDELGFIPNENNIYLGFIELLKQQYNIDNMQILEVGGGVIPRLGKRLSKEISTGSITVYDPRLSIYETEEENLRLVRKKFTPDTNVDNIDLIIGLMPCEACEIVIEASILHKKDFILALCEGGPHGEEFDYYEDEEEWRESIIRYASREIEKNGMGKLKIKHLRKYGDPYPIIYNDRG